MISIAACNECKSARSTCATGPTRGGARPPPDAETPPGDALAPRAPSHWTFSNAATGVHPGAPRVPKSQRSCGFSNEAEILYPWPPGAMRGCSGGRAAGYTSALGQEERRAFRAPPLGRRVQMVGTLRRGHRNDKANRGALARAVETHAAALAGWSAADMAEAEITPEQQADRGLQARPGRRAGAPRQTDPQKLGHAGQQPAPLTNTRNEAPPELREHRHGAVIIDAAGGEVVFIIERQRDDAGDEPTEASDIRDADRAWRVASGRGAGPPPRPKCQIAPALVARGRAMPIGQNLHPWR